MADVYVGLTGSPFAEAPTWTNLTAENSFVASCSIRRGRQDELQRTGTGTATVHLTFTDVGGDPTASADLVGRPIKIELTNPVTDTASPVFRGFVDELQYNVRGSQRVTDVTVECVDALDVFANIELSYETGAAANRFGYADPSGVTEGNIFYEDANVNVRIEKALAEVRPDWPTAMQRIFSGNVRLMEKVYSPRTSLLTVMQDAAESEFPGGVANLFVTKDGIVEFHGRLARFNPADPQYDIETWLAGDGAAIAVTPTRAQIRGLTLSRSRKRIINAAYCAPYGIADADVEGQRFTDATSIATYGYRAWSSDNLMTEIGFLGTPDRTGNEECALFAEYYVTNYKDPRTRVDQLTFKSLRPNDDRASATWALMCGVDISDIIDLVTTNPSASVAEDLYVEGLSYDIRPGPPEYDFVTLTLDCSPKAYWDTNPF